MKWKRNIYDADDAARSKRLKFTPEERAETPRKKPRCWAVSWSRQSKICPNSAALPSSAP